MDESDGFDEAVIASKLKAAGNRWLNLVGSGNGFMMVIEIASWR